ncbi:MAG: cyclic dehypoxanthinyl futalosine synthase [Thermodesulfobacteriota bacteirum]|nr:cyclic dehypoxanthinyl futalosine synthase [Thermodesulfobacteriota bacterium]
MDNILKNILNQKRISEQEGLKLLKDFSTLEIGQLANISKKQKGIKDEVGFVVDTNPNYTNICDTECLFCAFWRKKSHSDSYVLSLDKVIEIIKTSYHNGATTVLLQGGHNSSIKLDYYCDLIKRVIKEVPGIHLHAFSAPEIHSISKYSAITTKELLQLFWDLGLRTIPGGGAEVLSNKVRKKISPLKISADEWMRIIREAHLTGFKTTATIMFGHAEEDEDILEHLSRVRDLQDETNGFLSFIPWTFKPENTFMEKKISNEVGGDRYLRVLGLSRIFLDNFNHIQGSWFTQGFKVGGLALYYGANDVGGTLLQENVLKSANNPYKAGVDDIVHFIKSEGFTPVQRDTFYKTIKTY